MGGPTNSCSQPFFLTSGRFSDTHPGEIRHHSASTQYRARTGAQSKKTVVNQILTHSNADQDAALHYEQLRRDALGRSSIGSVGLTLFLRQGMAAWMQACAVGALLPARDSVTPANAANPLPADVRSAAVILAGIILHSRPGTSL